MTTKLYALFVVIVPVLVAVIVLTALGKEMRGIEFGGTTDSEAVRSGRSGWTSRRTASDHC